MNINMRQMAFNVLTACLRSQPGACSSLSMQDALNSRAAHGWDEGRDLPLPAAFCRSSSAKLSSKLQQVTLPTNASLHKPQGTNYSSALLFSRVQTTAKLRGISPVAGLLQQQAWELTA